MVSQSSWVNIMQRIWISRVTIRQSKINSNMNFDLTAAKNEVKERVFLLQLEVTHLYTCSIVKLYNLIGSTINQRTKSSCSLSQLLVVAGFVKLENLNHDFFEVVVVTKGGSIN